MITTVDDWEVLILADSLTGVFYYCLRGYSKNHPKYIDGTPLLIKNIKYLNVKKRVAFRGKKKYRLGKPNEIFQQNVGGDRLKSLRIIKKERIFDDIMH